jgi:hypothetical protein
MLSELEVRKQYQLQISNTFAALENIKRISKSQLKRVYVYMNRSSINHDLMQNVHNF